MFLRNRVLPLLSGNPVIWAAVAPGKPPLPVNLRRLNLALPETCGILPMAWLWAVVCLLCLRGGIACVSQNHHRTFIVGLAGLIWLAGRSSDCGFRHRRSNCASKHDGDFSCTIFRMIHKKLPGRERHWHIFCNAVAHSKLIYLGSSKRDARRTESGGAEFPSSCSRYGGKQSTRHAKLTTRTSAVANKCRQQVDTKKKRETTRPVRMFTRVFEMFWMLAKLLLSLLGFLKSCNTRFPLPTCNC